MRNLSVNATVVIKEEDVDIKLSHVIIFLTITTLILIGNTFTIMALRKVRKLKYTTKLFILSLSGADLVVGIFLIPLRLNSLFHAPWSKTAYWCRLSISFNILNLLASMLSLLLISIERMIYVTEPMKYHLIVTTRRSIIAIISVWILAFNISFVPIFTEAALQDNIERKKNEFMCRYAKNLKTRIYDVYVCYIYNTFIIICFDVL